MKSNSIYKERIRGTIRPRIVLEGEYLGVHSATALELA